MKISSNIRNVKPVFMDDNSFPVVVCHVGVSYSNVNMDDKIKVEKEKINQAIIAGADIICDVSLDDNIEHIHNELIKDLKIPFASVCIYETYINAQKNSFKIDENEIINTFKQQILRGSDMITIHATVFKDDKDLIKNSKRVIPNTSRGGVMMLDLMQINNFENPYYTHFDEILDLCSKYDVCLSLGPTYRPASVCDCNVFDELILLELDRMSVLVKKAQNRGVGIAIEGMGHASIDKIPQMIKLAKTKCHNAPYRVMSVSTDIALGFDHISSAISSAVSVYCGANSITGVTRKEHIGIPSIEDIKEGIISAKIAAYSGYIAKTNDYTKDLKMSSARNNNGCLGNLTNTLFPNLVKDMVKEDDLLPNRICTMCSEFCPLNKLKKI